MNANSTKIDAPLDLDQVIARCARNKIPIVFALGTMFVTGVIVEHAIAAIVVAGKDERRMRVPTTTIDRLARKDGRVLWSRSS